MKLPSPKQLCLDLMKRSQQKVQMAAVLEDKTGRIFSWGWASGWRHAEEMAIIRANPKRLSGATIYVAGRRTKSGNPVYAKPCERRGKNCLQLVWARGITKIVFRNKNGEWEILMKGVKHGSA